MQVRIIMVIVMKIIPVLQNQNLKQISKKTQKNQQKNQLKIQNLLKHLQDLQNQLKKHVNNEQKE